MIFSDDFNQEIPYFSVRNPLVLRVHREELLTRVPLGGTHGLHGSLRRDFDWIAGIDGNPKATKVSELIFAL